MSWVLADRSASAAAASLRSTRSSSTQRPRDRTSGRASLASRATSAAVSSTSSKTADHRTLASWLAPTTLSPVGSVNSRRPGETLRRERAGTRTSKPAARSPLPVVVISSQASGWLRYTCPRRWPPARRSSGRRRSSRASSSARGFVARLSVRATSIGSRPPSAPGPSTDRNQASPLSGGSSWTTRLGRAPLSTGLAHRSRRFETSVAAPIGASNEEPSSLVTTASATAAVVWVVGGGALTSTRPAASRMIASTTAPSTSIVTARWVPGLRAMTGPGMAAANRSISAGSRSAGTHRTARSIERPFGRFSAFSVGTTAPWVTMRTAANATRPSHTTLAPTPSRPRPPPTATSQPSDSCTGMATAAARAPDGNGTSACRVQPSLGPPMASRRSASSSFDSGAVPGPAPHTTILPASHEACSRTSPPGSAPAMTTSGSVTLVSRSYEASRRASSCGEVGHDLVTLRALDPADLLELVLRVVDEALEHQPPGARVGLEERDLVACGDALGHRVDGGLERSFGVIHRCCGDPSSPRAPRAGDGGACPRSASRGDQQPGVPHRRSCRARKTGCRVLPVYR